MENIVKIHYSGKDYIGQIKTIESSWSSGYVLENGYSLDLEYYKVCIYEKDTNCEIDNIFIHSFDEIKPYKGGANG